MNKFWLRFCVVSMVVIFATIASINSGLISKSWFSTSTNEERAEVLLPFTEEDVSALQNGFLLSREYQMKIFKRKFQQRSIGVLEFQNKMAEILDIPALLLPGNQTIRFQYILNTTLCGKNYNIRTRNYHTGYRANTTTIDVKSSTDGFSPPSQIINKFWLPAEQYAEGAITKFEWDVHPCKLKYSMETRINVPFETEVSTCGAMINFFPQIKEKVLEPQYNFPLSYATNFSGWWWELEHVGFLRDGVTEYKTAMTLEYTTREEAEAGLTIPIYAPEWSIRIWAPNHGHNKWLKSTLDDIDTKYAKVLDIMGSPDLPCDDPPDE